MKNTLSYRFTGYVEVEVEEGTEHDAIGALMGSVADVIRNDDVVSIADIDNWYEEHPTFVELDEFMQKNVVNKED